MKVDKKLYKIRQKSTGRYADGGLANGWSVKGKVWPALSHVVNHLNRSVDYYRSREDDVELVEFLVIENQPTPLRLIMDDADNRKVKRDAAYNRRAAESRLVRANAEKARLEKELARLNKELGK